MAAIPGLVNAVCRFREQISHNLIRSGPNISTYPPRPPIPQPETKSEDDVLFICFACLNAAVASCHTQNISDDAQKANPHQSRIWETGLI